MFNFDPALLAIEDGHRYRYDGQLVPYSATGVLKAAGMYKGLEFVTDAQRDAGTRVHDVVEMGLRHGWDNAIAALDPECEVRTKARAALDYITATGITIDHIEAPLYHTGFNVAGQADIIGHIGADVCVLDWKSGGVQGATALQLALYAACLEKSRAVRRIAISLAGGKYHPHEYPRLEFQRDLNKFGACLTVIQTRAEFGIN